MKSFASDYDGSRPHPAIVSAEASACELDHEGAYLENRFTHDAAMQLAQLFGARHACFVPNGTAANCLAIDTMLNHSYQAVICSEWAHIKQHEAGGTGHEIIAVATTRNGKIKLAAVGHELRLRQDDIHRAQPAMISISQPTELGTIYEPDELNAIAHCAEENELVLHIDGARLANAAAARSVERIRDIIDTKSDPLRILTLGATKNGGKDADAMVVFAEEYVEIAARMQKKHRQVCAREWGKAAQVLAMYGGDLWRENATKANTMATLLGRRLSQTLCDPVVPVQTNAVFVRLPKPAITALQKKTPFHVVGNEGETARFMCSWDTTEQDVEGLVRLINEIVLN